MPRGRCSPRSSEDRPGAGQVEAPAGGQAICLNFSFLEDRHERRLAEALARAFPGLPLYLSSAVNPQMEEYPRANTTALAAYVGVAVVDHYLGDVEAKLAAVGAGFRPLWPMRSDGGVATPWPQRPILPI